MRGKIEAVRKNKKEKICFEKIEEIKNNPKAFQSYQNKIHYLYENMPHNFEKRIRYLREMMSMTREELEEKSNISLQTIKQIELNKKRVCSLKTIFALCIGMSLPPDISFELIKNAGYNIENNNSKKEILYCVILRNLYNSSIEEINDFIKKNLEE